MLWIRLVLAKNPYKLNEHNVMQNNFLNLYFCFPLPYRYCLNCYKYQAHVLHSVYFFTLLYFILPT